MNSKCAQPFNRRWPGGPLPGPPSAPHKDVQSTTTRKKNVDAGWGGLPLDPTLSTPRGLPNEDVSSTLQGTLRGNLLSTSSARVSTGPPCIWYAHKTQCPSTKSDSCSRNTMHVSESPLFLACSQNTMPVIRPRVHETQCLSTKQNVFGMLTKHHACRQNQVLCSRNTMPEDQ